MIFFSKGELSSPERWLVARNRERLKEIERSQQNESQWQLHQIVSYLTDVSKVSIEANTSGPSPYQDSSIRQVYDQQTGEQDYDEEYQEINAVQRGSQQKFRGRFLRQRGNQVGGQRGRGRSYTPRRNNYNTGRRGANMQFRGANPFQRGTGRKPPVQNIAAQLKSLNLPPRSCLMCAQPIDGVGCSGPSSQSCPYRDVAQMQSNCYNFKPHLLLNYNKNTSDRTLCTGGKHSAATCVGVILNALNHRRRWLASQQQGGANNVVEDSQEVAVLAKGPRFAMEVDAASDDVVCKAYGRGAVERRMHRVGG